jgi:hypothetical protein
MMQVQITVEGTTFAELETRKQRAIDDFMAGAPTGSTCTIEDIGIASKVSTTAVVDPATQAVATVPVYQITTRWSVTTL